MTEEKKFREFTVEAYDEVLEDSSLQAHGPVSLSCKPCNTVLGEVLNVGQALKMSATHAAKCPKFQASPGQAPS